MKLKTFPNPQLLSAVMSFPHICISRSGFYPICGSQSKQIWMNLVELDGRPQSRAEWQRPKSADPDPFDYHRCRSARLFGWICATSSIRPFAHRVPKNINFYVYARTQSSACRSVLHSRTLQRWFQLMLSGSERFQLENHRSKRTFHFYFYFIFCCVLSGEDSALADLP